MLIRHGKASQQAEGERDAALAAIAGNTPTPERLQALSEAEVPFVDGLDSFVDAQQAYRETQARSRTTKNVSRPNRSSPISRRLSNLCKSSTKLPKPNKPQSLLGAILQRQNS